MVLNVPRAFRDYACERSMLCCGAPVLAPVSVDEEAAVRTALGATEAGRALLPGLSETIDLPARAWRQERGRCVHLAATGDAPACQLHRAAGLAALPMGCRNFPRVVNAADESAWDVAFTLLCPTAARLLAEHPEPWEIVTVPRDGWPYLRTSHLPLAPERMALRDAWLEALKEARADPARLVAAIGAMLETPETPSAGGDAGWISDSVMPPLGPMAALFAVHKLAARRERGADYDRHGQALLDAMLTTWPKRALVAAVSATPEYVAVFVEHGVDLLRTHTTVDVQHTLALTARRALAVIRLVDTACTLVPFRTATLFADAYQAVALLDPAV